MTIHLSNVVASPVQSAGEACTIRSFRHTDFSRSASPVVSVDHFVMTGPATAPEPAAGLCAATLLLEDSKGVMQSLDSTKDDHEIRAGDLHWTQAGQGILRVQQPTEQDRLHGLRIGFKLADRQLAPPPAVAVLRGWEMPVIQTSAGRIRVAAGNHEGWQSPLATPEPLMLLDAWLRPGATQLVPLPSGWNAWIFAVQGDLGVRARHRLTGAPPLPKRPGGDPDFAVVPAGSALVASASIQDDPGVLVLMAGRVPAHFVLIAGCADEVPMGLPAAAATPGRRGATPPPAACNAGDLRLPQPDLAA